MFVYPYILVPFLDLDNDGDVREVGNPLNPRGSMCFMSRKKKKKRTLGHDGNGIGAKTSTNNVINAEQKAHETQIAISASIGLLAFLLFCFLRPRWYKLYAARKRRLKAGMIVMIRPSTEKLTLSSTASLLPDLPKGFFAWIPILYNIDEHQVLASAGLDAFVVSILLFLICNKDHILTW